MKQYVTIKRWHDLKDNNYKYNIGDVYPREGLEPSKNRIKELSSNKNRRNRPLIEELQQETALEPEKEVESIPEDINVSEGVDEDGREENEGITGGN